MNYNYFQYRALQKINALYLNISPSSIVLNRKSHTITIIISSNTGWTVNCEESWIDISNTSDKGNKEVQVNIQENNLAIYRLGIIKISTLNSSLEKTLIVTQLGTSATPYLKVTPINKTIEQQGSTFQLDIESNITFEIEYPDPPIKIEENG